MLQHRLGGRAVDAKLLLFGVEAEKDLRAASQRREDVELVDLERLYQGSESTNVEVSYYRERAQSGLGHQSPADYEAALTAA